RACAASGPAAAQTRRQAGLALRGRHARDGRRVHQRAAETASCVPIARSRVISIARPQRGKDQADRMLTGKMVRVRYHRERIVPCYLDVASPAWLEVAERLLEVYRGSVERTRGELEEDVREIFGDDPGQLAHQGVAKLLEDRCEFEVVAGHPPEQLR